MLLLIHRATPPIYLIYISMIIKTVIIVIDTKLWKVIVLKNPDMLTYKSEYAIVLFWSLSMNVCNSDRVT